MKEAKPDLLGVAIVDHLPEGSPDDAGGLRWKMWERREIENYVCQPETLLAFARGSAQQDSPGELFVESVSERRAELMERCIEQFVPPAALRDRDDPWWRDVKASDEFLNRVFAMYYEQLELPNLMLKRDYHVLGHAVPLELVEEEIGQVLDMIAMVAADATPR